MPLLSREILDRLSCQNPNCTHADHEALYLHAKCHISSPTWAKYVAGSGVLQILCAECNAVVAQIAVASIETGAPSAN
jgi:hypothetical protein